MVGLDDFRQTLERSDEGDGSASSSMTGAGPEVVPALEILTDLPFSAVNVSLNEPALLRLSSEYSVNVFCDDCAGAVDAAQELLSVSR